MTSKDSNEHKILIIMNDYTLMGGVEKVTSNLIEVFLKNKMNVWGIWSLNSFNSEPHIVYPENINIKIESDIEQLEDFVADNDIKYIIVQIGDIWSGYKIARIFKESKVKVISVLHSSPYLWLKKFYIEGFLDHLRWVKMFLWNKYKYKNLMRNLIDDSYITLFVSKKACSEAQMLFPSLSHKIDYIYNFSMKFNNSIKSPYTRTNTIMYAGRLDKTKRVYESIKVLEPILKKHRDWEYLILGDGEDRNKIEQFIKKNNLYNVKVVGKVKNVHEYLQKSKICILYSLFEGLPTILLEAAEYRIPIVAFCGAGGTEDIIINNKNGFLVNNDKELYERVLLLIEDSDILNKLLTNENDYSQYNEEVILDKWRKLFIK